MLGSSTDLNTIRLADALAATHEFERTDICIWEQIYIRTPASISYSGMRMSGGEAYGYLMRVQYTWYSQGRVHTKENTKTTYGGEYAKRSVHAGEDEYIPWSIDIVIQT